MDALTLSPSFGRYGGRGRVYCIWQEAVAGTFSKRRPLNELKEGRGG